MIDFLYEFNLEILNSIFWQNQLCLHGTNFMLKRIANFSLKILSSSLIILDETWTFQTSWVRAAFRTRFSTPVFRITIRTENGKEPVHPEVFSLQSIFQEQVYLDVAAIEWNCYYNFFKSKFNEQFQNVEMCIYDVKAL